MDYEDSDASTTDPVSLWTGLIRYQIIIERFPSWNHAIGSAYATAQPDRLHDSFGGRARSPLRDRPVDEVFPKDTRRVVLVPTYPPTYLPTS